jgi:integrase
MARHSFGGCVSRPGPSIRIWDVSYRRGRGRPWYVRWSVNGQERGPKTFTSEDEAEDYRARLRIAARDGEKWNINTGLPVSWNPLMQLDVATFCRLEWTRRTKSRKARTAASLAETFSRFVVATVPARSAAFPVTYAELSRWIQGSETSKKPDERRKLNDWLKRWSPSMDSLDKVSLKRVHDALMVGANGRPLSASVVRRRFTEVTALLNYAVKEGVLTSNELAKPDKTTYEHIETNRSKVYPSMPEMLSVVEAVESRQSATRLYRAMTAVGVLAGLRPSEIVALEMRDVDLPEEGWGEIRVERARVGLAGWSEDDQEIGRPKAKRSTRTIPIPQRLVVEIRSWIEAAEIEDGPLFLTRNGTLPLSSNWTRLLKVATVATDVRSMTPYDLRRFHGTWLAESGVPYNEAARRMGHDLAVFMSVYVGTTGDIEAVGNAALDRALR